VAFDNIFVQPSFSACRGGRTDRLGFFGCPPRPRNLDWSWA